MLSKTILVIALTLVISKILFIGNPIPLITPHQPQLIIQLLILNDKKLEPPLILLPLPQKLPIKLPNHAFLQLLFRLLLAFIC